MKRIIYKAVNYKGNKQVFVIRDLIRSLRVIEICGQVVTGKVQNFGRMSLLSSKDKADNFGRAPSCGNHVLRNFQKEDNARV